MDEDTRREVEELVMLYELEPTVRDIYVEGPSDRAFMVGVSRRLGLKVQIREVDFVKISSAQLDELDLGIGCRQRVIALAILLERVATLDLSSQVACIADADDEAGRSPKFTGSLLLYTDVSSMTTYAFASQYLQWYLDVVVLGFPLTGEQVVSALIPVLRVAALLRRCSCRLGLSVAMVDLTSDCEIAGDIVEFDRDRCLLRFLNKAGAHSRREEFETEIASRTSLAADPRLWVHAEDFTSILHWLIVRLRGPTNTVAKHLLARTLLLGIPNDDIASWPLFGTLLARMGPISESA
jgi:hypothetical protein